MWYSGWRRGTPSFSVAEELPASPDPLFFAYLVETVSVSRRETLYWGPPARGRSLFMKNRASEEIDLPLLIEAFFCLALCRFYTLRFSKSDEFSCVSQPFGVDSTCFLQYNIVYYFRHVISNGPTVIG